jgi:type VI secretion system protein ImpF
VNRPDLQRLPLLSVLDRLLDADPDREREAPKSRRQALAELREAVRRDLESLLNTRHRPLAWPATLDALGDSLLNFGIPDFASANLATRSAQDEFRRSVEAAIRRFEPRFMQVSVQLIEPGDSLERSLRFRIEALMRLDPEPEPVVLDSLLDPATNSFAVRAGREG